MEKKITTDAIQQALDEMKGVGSGKIPLPDIGDVKKRLENYETPLWYKQIDLDALMYGALVHSIHKRDARLVRPKAIRRGHLVRPKINPLKGKNIIAKVKRAQHKNAKKHRRVYKRVEKGGNW